MINNFLSIIQVNNSETITILFLILGGLGVFLYGLNLMSSSIESLAGSNLKMIVSKATNNSFKGFLVGILLTILIQSSSATTVIVVGLIGAGILDLKKALPIMIGAHIGATITAYIIGLDIGMICYPLIFVGAFIILLLANRKAKLSGRIIVGFGLLFLGLELMSISITPIKEQESFKNLLVAFNNSTVLSSVTGLLLTAFIQSSGAFIGITQELYIASNMELNVALALVIGSNIGTTVTALIASISGNKESKQAALSNTIMVMVGAIIMLPFVPLLSKLFNVIELSFFTTKNKFTIALFHTFFNIITAAISFLLIPLLIKISTKLLPNKEREEISALNLSKELIKTPSVALESARISILDMTELVNTMFSDSILYFKENNHKLFEEINALEEKVDRYEHLLHDYLMSLSETHLNQIEYQTQTEYIDIVRDLERIGDHSVNFSEFLENYYSKDALMNKEMFDALLFFFEEVDKQVKETIEAFKNNDKKLSKSVLEREEKIDSLEKEYRRNVHKYVKQTEINTLDITFVDIVSNLERISDHTTNICEMIIDPHMTSIDTK